MLSIIYSKLLETGDVDEISGVSSFKVAVEPSKYLQSLQCKPRLMDHINQAPDHQTQA